MADTNVALADMDDDTALLVLQLLQRDARAAQTAIANGNHGEGEAGTEESDEQIAIKLFLEE